MAKRKGDIYIKSAEKAGCRIVQGNGDHVKVYPPCGGRPMVIPRDLKGNGTEYAIIKFLRALGITISIIIAVAWFITGG